MFNHGTGSPPSYWGQELQAGEKRHERGQQIAASLLHGMVLFDREWVVLGIALLHVFSLEAHASGYPRARYIDCNGVAGWSTPTDINADVQDRHPSRNVAQRREGGTGARAARWALCQLGLQVSSGTLARVLAENLGLHPRIHASTAWLASDLNALGHPGTEFVVLLP